MFYRILKKDLKHRRGINVILFLFMILATVFVASSVNNILVISNATNYCMDKGQVADEYICAIGPDGETNISNWLNGNNLVKNYSKNEAVFLSKGNIDSFNGKDGSEYDSNGTILIQKQWDQNMLIFDQQGNQVNLKNGEIGMQQKEMDLNGLKLGDTITMKFGDTRKTFKITTVVMDPAFGGDFVGMTRYIISPQDFQSVKDAGMSISYNYNVNTYDNTSFVKSLNKQCFSTIVTLERSSFATAYVMSMVTAGILIIVGICLIIIAFLILRFTIVFTLQEDYKEIGIMKAVGIRNFTIKKIYLVKYFALVSVAAIIGCFCSIPVSNYMLQSVSKTMLMENASVNFGVNIVCSIVVAALVLVLCYLCTNKLRKFSAIEAIRSGQTGERFKKKSLLSLNKCRKIPATLYMAVNDILSNVKRYIVLILTFAIGTIIIILPLNTITSMQSNEMVKSFVLDTSANFYIGSDVIDTEDVTAILDTKVVQQNLNSIEANFKSKGYDVSANAMTFFTISYYTDDPDDSYQVMSMKPINSDGSFVELLDGTTPKNDNEIALSEKVMKKMGVSIGDTIHAKIKGEDKKLIITGTYQNYMQMGQSAFLNGKVDTDGMQASGIWMIQCYLHNQNFTKDTLSQLKKDFSEYTFYNAQEAMSKQLGSTLSQLGSIKVMLVALIFLVNILITILMMKIFIMGEKGQIAMLRSVGFSLRAIRWWQTLRIGVVLLLGVLLGVLCSIPLNDIVLRPVFGMMGATHMKIQVNPVEAYLGYPLLLLLIICIAAYISAGTIKKFHLMEINNAE